MKQTWIIRTLLLAAYSIPYAFLCVNGDAASGTMLWYVAMAAAFSLLYCAAVNTKNIAVLYIGNIVSYLSSWATAKLYGLEPMGYYFKPFTSQSLMAAITIFVIAVQTLLLLNRNKKTK